MDPMDKVNGIIGLCRGQRSIDCPIMYLVPPYQPMAAACVHFGPRHPHEPLASMSTLICYEKVTAR